MQFGTVRLSVSVRGDVPYQAYIPLACLVAVLLILKRGGDLFLSDPSKVVGRHCDAPR